jgi:putative membrane protein
MTPRTFACLSAIGALAGLAVLASCGADPRAYADTTHAAPELTRVSDGGMIGTLAVMNSSEIEAARLASAKATDPELRALATQLVRDHETMKRSLDSLMRRAGLARQSTTDAMAIQARGRSLVDTLGVLAGRDFDLVYVNAQVGDHQMALQTLSGWQAAADSRALQHELRAARAVVQAHYDHAVAIQSRLGAVGETNLWKKQLGMPVAASDRP